jgi:carbamoyltransferase
MTILGISAFYHDSAAAVIRDGVVVAAAQEERFTRKKNDASFPEQSIRFCLTSTDCTIDDIDTIAFYDKPLLKFERLLETYYAFAPRGLTSFLSAMPVWIKEKLFLKKMIYDGLKQIGKFDKRKLKLVFPEHHLSHAASAFFPSAFNEAAILTIDGVGEWATTSICLGKENKITVLKELHFPHSIGLLYSSFTYFCGFKVNDGEYKLMGLAPYGNISAEETQRFIRIIKNQLIDIKEDGSFLLDQQYFNYTTGLRMVKDREWELLFGVAKRKPDEEVTQSYCNLALAIQHVTEELVIGLAKETKRLTNADFLCMAGGVALNCVANGKLHELNLYKDIFIQPAAGDAGGSLGAALATHYIYYNNSRKITDNTDKMNGSYLGPEFFDENIISVINKFKAIYKRFDDENEMLNAVAKLLSTGNIIGWHQGRMEFGPRALGARSILADARDPEMQKRLNSKIKNRESFRPFAPIVLLEDVADFFELEDPSPYMLFAKKVKRSRCIPQPEGYDLWQPREKLNFPLSDIPAVTHVDYSARIQTINKQTNLRLWDLLQAFKKVTGYSVLVNTSFNVRDEPIVNTPEDAFNCFMKTEMDHLIIGNYIFSKGEQRKISDK